MPPFVVFRSSAVAAIRALCVVGCLMLAAEAASLHASEVSWHDSFENALTESGQTGRPILAIFTGSDWCPHCKTLEDHVLDTPAFADWARERVVLLEIDMPQEGITREVRLERSRVCLTYGVRSFPSVVLIGSDGSKLFSHSGYTGQSTPLWISMVAEHLPPPPRVASIEPGPATADPSSVVDERPSTVARPAVKAARGVHGSLESAVASAKAADRPVLLLVSRSSNAAAATQSQSLLADPEFRAFAEEHFVMASVPPDAPAIEEAEAVDRLLGGVTLPDDAVELVVTLDGETPVFTQSGRQPPSRVVSGLRRFLRARAAARETTAYR
jgi:thiol-disulfide isomerase/thioredoxin